MAKKKKTQDKQRTDRGEGDILKAVQLFDKFGNLTYTGEYIGEPLPELPDYVFKESTTDEFLIALATGDYQEYDLGTATGELYEDSTTDSELS